MNSLDVLDEVISLNPEISTFHFFQFNPSAKIQERLINPTEAERDLINSAIQKKGKSGLPFWEALLSTVLENGSWSKSLLAATLLHQPNPELIKVDKDIVRQYFLENAGSEIACNSTVTLSTGETAHIPLLDFKAPYSSRNCMLVSDCVRQLGLKGLVINSGRSFHFWGGDLVTKEGLLALLGRFSLLHPISDKSWAAHQIMEGSASLRITPRHNQWPEVVARIE